MASSGMLMAGLVLRDVVQRRLRMGWALLAIGVGASLSYLLAPPAKASILKGCSIKDNIMIAAHSLVNKNMPPNSVVGGVPAKILKTIK